MSIIIVCSVSSEIVYFITKIKKITVEFMDNFPTSPPVVALNQETKLRTRIKKR